MTVDPDRGAEIVSVVALATGIDARPHAVGGRHPGGPAITYGHLATVR